MTQPFQPPLEMFYHWEAQRPDATWLRQPEGAEWRDYSWSQAGAQARRLAAALQNMGLKHDDKVGIYAANSANWIIADLAIMMAGGVSVPIYTTMPEDKVSYVIDHSEMKFLFADDSGALSPKSFVDSYGDDLQVISMGAATTKHHLGALLETTAPIDGNPVRDIDDLWTIVYTSGTTGQPKGVMHSFRTLPSSGAAIPAQLGMSEDTRYFSYLPLAHVAERSVVELQSFYSGGMIGFNQSLETFVPDLCEIRPTYFFAVPRIWAKLKMSLIAKMGDATWTKIMQDEAFAAEMGKTLLANLGLDQLVIAATGSAPTPADDIKAWCQLGVPLREGYGMSETMSGTFNQIDVHRIGSVGKLIAEGSELKLSAEGEILFRSQGNMLGYYKAPDKTAETIIDGWVHTGDKGRIDEDGFLFITGRVKEIFKTAKGKYVAPSPIEQKFSTIPLIEQSCLVGRGMVQPALLTILAESDTSREDLTAALTEQLGKINPTLEAHERIDHIVICREPWTIENGLLTHTMKMKRDVIEEHYVPLLEQIAKEGGEAVVWED